MLYYTCFVVGAEWCVWTMHECKMPCLRVVWVGDARVYDAVPAGISGGVERKRSDKAEGGGGR